MLTISSLTTLLGRASVLDIAYFFIAALAMMLMKSVLFSVREKLFNVNGSELSTLYFTFLSHYKSQHWSFLSHRILHRTSWGIE